MGDNDVEMAILQSQDGQEFSIPVQHAIQSETIKNLIEDAGIDNAIPLPNVTGKILSKVVEYCKYHAENPNLSSDQPAQQADQMDIIPWDLDFCKVDQATLFELILAANYLDIAPLLDLTCKTVANMIKGKTPDEICKTFNIENDFTPEEMEQVRRENEWVDER